LQNRLIVTFEQRTKEGKV